MSQHRVAEWGVQRGRAKPASTQLQTLGAPGLGAQALHPKSAPMGQGLTMPITLTRPPRDPPGPQDHALGSPALGTPRCRDLSIISACRLCPAWMDPASLDGGPVHEADFPTGLADFPTELVGSNQPLKSWALCISSQARRIGAEPGTSSSLEPHREQVTGLAQLPAGQRAIAEPAQGHSVGLSPGSPSPTAHPWVPGDGAVGRRGAGTQGCSTAVACRRCFLTCMNETELISPAGLLMIWCNYELLQLTGSCSPPGSMSLGEECHHQSDGDMQHRPPGPGTGLGDAGE